MKQNTCKIISLLLVLVMLISAISLTACSSDSVGKKVDPPKKTTINAENVKDLILDAIANVALSTYDEESAALYNQEMKDEIYKYLLESDFDGEDGYSRIISVLETAGIKESDVAALCEMINDFSEIVAKISSSYDYYDDYSMINAIFTKSVVSDMQAIAKKFMKTIPVANMSALIVELLTIAEKSISDDFDETGMLKGLLEELDFDLFALIVGEVYAVIEVLANKNPQELADFLKFTAEMLSGYETEEILSGNGKYSYKQMVTFINYGGEIIIELADISSKYTPKLTEKMTSIIETWLPVYLEYLALDDETEAQINEYIASIKDNSDNANAIARLIGTMMKDIDAATVSALYLDYDGAVKALSVEQEEAYFAAIWVRIAKIINSAYDKLSSKDKTAITKSIAEVMKLSEMELSADDIISDLKKLAAYNPDNLSDSDVQTIMDLLMSYEP